MVLLAGINPNIMVEKYGRVREKERTFDCAKKALLSNVNSFLDELKGLSINTLSVNIWLELRFHRL